ncbi:MAG: bifunctional salicylyl-CoA 5-hydroxylase/oxidoreductase [Myxococcota bacterium]
MKVHVLGGGPGGLYFSLLLKKARPDAEVTVFERNAANSTFGWGVVFSAATLGHFGEADAESYRAIQEDFAYWDAIDTHFWKGGHRVIRSGGHGFCGIGRMRLLLLLQERARSLGVKTVFGTEIDDLEALRGECDLLVAADGINSKTRGRYADTLKPTVREGDARFIWLGTHQPFEAFTFSFRENDHGLFQIHAYQFDQQTSTCIVECDEDSWRAAGLHEADEATTLRYCADLFRDELGGRPLLANRSAWIRFREVKCERWHHENVVLIGDAAHTAHFGIGSGTKLAMEDAIELAGVLADAEDVSLALGHYEDARRDMAGRIQRSAQQAQQWFEESKRHLKHPPERVTFSLLSRTRRITHENLRERDPAYIEAVDRWYMEEQGLPKDGPITPPLFTPFTLKGLRLSNRIVVSPMCQYSAIDGVPNDWHLVHLGSRAVGGAGLIFTEMTNVAADARITPGCTGLYNDAQQAAWTRIVDFVHGQSESKIAIQLGHAGRKGSTKLLWEGMDQPLPDGAGWPILGPSPIAYAPNHAPREMNRDDMVRVRDEHVAAARRAAACGFDLLELHMAHGYLLSSFLSPVSNQRADEYGGDAAKRARYPLEVLEAIRQVWTGPLSVRISATDWVPGGFTLDDAVELAGWLKERGADIVDVSSGQVTPDEAPVYGRAFQTPFSERIRNEVGIPTIAVGNIYDHDRINTILVAGRADLVALARAHLADPYLARHAASELGHSVRWPPQYRASGGVLDRMFPAIEPASE